MYCFAKELYFLVYLFIFSDGFASCNRYLPLRRTQVPLSSESRLGADCSFPSLSCDEIEKTASSSLIRCKFGSVEAVAKVCTSKSLGTFTLKLSRKCDLHFSVILHPVIADNTCVTGRLILPLVAEIMNA